MGIVYRVTRNDLGEVTAVDVRKGSNREIVRRHISTIIPLLTTDMAQPVDDSQSEATGVSQSSHDTKRTKRAAASKCESAIRKLVAVGSV